MYAIVEMAGQQFKVAKDQKVYVHRLAEDEGKKVVFDKVLLLDDNGTVTLGAPAIDGAAVEAKIIKHLRGDKVIVFKKKRRKGYKKKNGHRQHLTEIVVEGIVAKGAKKADPAKTKAEKPEATPKTAKPVKKVEAEKAAPKAEAVTEMQEDLSSKTVSQLKEMAKAAGITGYSSLKKAELIQALRK